MLTNSLKYQYHYIYMLEHGCVVCFSFRPRMIYIYLTERKLLLSKKNILKNLEKREKIIGFHTYLQKNDHLPL